MTALAAARFRRTGALVGLGGAGAAQLVSGPITWPCPFRLLTGFDCPGCGGTRMLESLLRGDVAAALQHNAFLLLVGAPAAIAVLVGLARVESGRAVRAWPAGRLGRGIGRGLLVALLLWTLARNLPFAPFTALSSGG
ncbi:DUF2752 domain-containing protein [Salinifilum ghardaiensis]